MKYPLDVVICTNANRDITVGTALAMVRLVGTCKFQWICGGGISTAMTRSLYATYVVKSGAAPSLLFIDRDMIFVNSDVGLILDGLEKGYEIIGGLYVTRDGTQAPMLQAKEKILPLDGKVHQVNYLASGFMGISVELLKRMIKELELPLLNEGKQDELYPFFQEGPCLDSLRGKTWFGEDYYFCHLAGKLGVKPHVDTRVQVGHAGNAIWRPVAPPLNLNELQIQMEAAGDTPRAEDLKRSVYE